MTKITEFEVLFVTFIKLLYIILPNGSAQGLRKVYDNGRNDNSNYLIKSVI